MYTKVWTEWFDLLRLVEAELGGSEMRLLVVYFVSRHMEGGGSASAIEQKLSGLTFLFKLQGMLDFTRDFWVKQALKGYRKSHLQRDTRRTVSFVILQAIDKKERMCSWGMRYFCFGYCFLLHFSGLSGSGSW